MKNIVESNFMLESLGLVDSPPEPEFDSLTKLAADTIFAPVSLLSFVQHDKNRQYFKSRFGLELEQTPLSHSFCRTVVESGEALIVDDAPNHPVVCRNPAITDLNVYSYLGVPVTDPHGVAIASLCVIDSKPRRWRTQDIQTVGQLASFASSIINLKWESATLDNMLREQRDFVDAISQEITEPLQRINLIVENFLTGHDNASDSHQKILWEMAQNSAARTQNLLDDVEHCSELAYDESTNQTVELNRLLKDTLDGLRTDNHDFNAKILAGPLPTVSGNAKQLAILLRNLISHALLFHAPFNSSAIRIESTSADNYATIRLSYSGAGLMLTQKGKKTDKMQSSSSKIYNNNSVGMALVERITRNHLGSLSVYSDGSNRVEYLVRLPIHKQPAH